MSRFRGPVRRSHGQFSLHLSANEVEILRRLLGDLDELLEHHDASTPDERTRRLFPVAHPDDPTLEAEYQQMTRPELVAGRRAAIATVSRALASNDRLDEEQLLAFMQSLNSIRLVLGSMLDVSDDLDRPEIAAGAQDSPEYHLYGYLSWLLDSTVRALSAEL